VNTLATTPKEHIINIEGIINLNLKAYEIDDVYQDVKIDEILIFRYTRYKVTSIGRYGIIAFKILKSGNISKSSYIQLGKSTLSEKTKRNR